MANVLWPDALPDANPPLLSGLQGTGCWMVGLHIPHLGRVSKLSIPNIITINLGKFNWPNLVLLNVVAFYF